jgi:hypothetical protein
MTGPRDYVKWAPITRKAIFESRLKKAADLRKEKVFRSYQYSEKESFKQLNDSGRERLKRMEGAFEYLFENSGLRLGYMQKRLIEVIKIAFFRKMFGDDLVPNLNFLKKRYLIEELADSVAILFPVFKL